MVESTCFQHTSSHPDKHNNSVDRIISKEEEREDPRRDSSIYLRVQNTVVFPQIIHILQELQDSFEYSVFYSVSTRNPSSFQVIPHAELILLQELLQLQYSSRAGSFQQLFPVSPSILHGRIRLPASLTAFQGHSAQAGFQLILGGRNSTPSSRQHPRSPYSSSQAPFPQEFYQEK